MGGMTEVLMVSLASRTTMEVFRRRAIKKSLENVNLPASCIIVEQKVTAEVSGVIKPEAEEPDRPTGPPTTRDGQAFEQFFRAHFETIRRRVYAAGLDLALADDVTQEAMAIAFRYWERVSVTEHPVAYVTTIAINILRRARRKDARVRDALSQAHPDELLPATAPGHENAVANRLDLEHALRSIPADQAECFVLHHMFGCKYKKIALELGIPEGTVKSRVHTARTALKEILGYDTMGGLW
jgi:RNA polymerase sigma factor (sigma-70 family)